MKSFRIISDYQCIFQCSKSDLCSIAIVDSSICSLINYVQITDSIAIYSSTSTIYVKDQESLSKEINNYLIHYWPFNGNYFDVISNANLFNGLNASFVPNRFGRASSSVYLNYGCLQAPDGVYFRGDFTISVWLKPRSIVSDNRVLDFGVNSPDVDNIILAYAGPYGHVCNNGTCKWLSSPSSLKLNKWQHLAFSLSGSTGYLYINGKLVRSDTGFTTPRAVIRTNCFIGKSNYGGGSQSVEAFFDDIKIFNKSLSQTEIIRNSFMNL
jgi:hypothetical protein